VTWFGVCTAYVLILAANRESVQFVLELWKRKWGNWGVVVQMSKAQLDCCPSS